MTQAITIDHESGQRFVQHSGRIANVGTFNVPATKQVDTSTGELITKAGERRFQLTVKTASGLIVKLDSVNTEQLQIITGKELQPEHMRLLRNAEATWYTSKRIEGQLYYFRPDATNARLSPRTGAFTSLALIEPADAAWDKWDNIPDRDSTVPVTNEPDESFAEFQATVRAQLGIGEPTLTPADEAKPEDDTKDSKKKQS